MMSPCDAAELSRAYAFLGNSLLSPMNQTDSLGLDPAFWKAFPDFGNEPLRRALDAMADRMLDEGGEHSRQERVRCISVEYAKLFIGPPEPAAPPWESMHGDHVPDVGFQEPAFQMQGLFRAIGVEVSGPSNQYADHMGLELLYVSERLRLQADDAPGAADIKPDVDQFLKEHPLSWIDSLEAQANGICPQGYYACVLGIAQVLMRATVNLTSGALS